jgi:hypothetical protein
VHSRVGPLGAEIGEIAPFLHLVERLLQVGTWRDPRSDLTTQIRGMGKQTTVEMRVGCHYKMILAIVVRGSAPSHANALSYGE